MINVVGGQSCTSYVDDLALTGYISYVEKCMAKDRRPLEAGGILERMKRTAPISERAVSVTQKSFVSELLGANSLISLSFSLALKRLDDM